jgi:hypothetical protein
MNSFLNHKLDFVFIITPNILLKHNNYLYQNIKIDNYFIETMIYDFNKPLNELNNYFFTIKKILKIAIMRNYTNIMILNSEILLIDNWIQNINNLISSEPEINNNNYGIIWLESEQEKYTKSQQDEINTKNYYTHIFSNDLDNESAKLNITYGNNGLIISKKIFYNLYKIISENLSTNNSDKLKESYHNVCIGTNSYVIYPNILININKLKPLYDKLNLIKSSKDKKIYLNKISIINPKLRTLIINNSKINLAPNNDYIDMDKLKEILDNGVSIGDLSNNNLSNDNLLDNNTSINLSNNNLFNDKSDIELHNLYTQYVVPYFNQQYIYNPNYFSVFFNFTKEIIQHFDWIFYKYFYDDLINDDNINTYEDTITHYINIGYEELRYICLDEYLYDKNDSEYDINIKSMNIDKYYKANKEIIDSKNLSIKPIIYYIKYECKKII